VKDSDITEMEISIENVISKNDRASEEMSSIEEIFDILLNYHNLFSDQLENVMHRIISCGVDIGKVKTDLDLLNNIIPSLSTEKKEKENE